MNHLSKESNLFSSCSRRSWYLRFVYDRKRSASASAPGSSPSSSEPHQIQVLAGVIVPKRTRKLEQKPKLSFGFESTSRGPDNKPSNMKTDLLELLVHFRTQQESQHGKRLPTEARNESQGHDSQCHSTVKNTTTSRTMSGRECKRLSAGKSKISLSKSVEGDDEAFNHDTQKPKLTKEGAIDIITQLRDFLRENGPSEEHDLRKALSISEVQMILDMGGTITAFLGRSSLFEVIYEDLYTFVYYNCADDEDDQLAENFADFLNDSIRQNGLADDCVRQATGLLSSDSIVDVSGRGGEDNEPAACRRNNASSQISSLRLHHSRALQDMQQTCDAKVETQRCQPGQITELKSGPQKRDVKITQFKHRSNAIPEGQACKSQQIDDKIHMVGRTTPPRDLVPTRTTAKVSNVSTSKKHRKSQGAHESGAQACSREPKPRPFSNPSQQHQPKAEQKQLVFPVRQLPSFMSLIRGISPPHHRKMFEKKNGFPNGPRLQPMLTPRRRHPPLPPKSEKSHAPPTQTTSQPAYPRRRSTRSKAEERPCSIRIGQNILLKPRASPRSPPESRQEPLKKFWPFPIIPRPQPAPTRPRRLPPLPFMAGEKPRGPPITSTTHKLSSCHQDLPASRRKAEKRERVLPVASTSFPVPPLHRGSPAHQTKVEERPFSISTCQKSPLKFQPHRRSPSNFRRKTQENIHTFPIEQSSRPAPTRRRTPRSLPPKSEKSHAPPTQTTSQPAYPRRRSTRSKAEEKPCSIGIGQNTLLKPRASPRSPPESRQKTLKKFRPFPIIPRPQPVPTWPQRLPPLPFMAEEKPRGPPITSTTQPLSSCHQDLPASRRKAEKRERALPVASTSFPVPPLHRRSPAHQAKVEERPFYISTRQKSPLKFQPHRRSPSNSRQKTQENIRTFPIEQSPRPAPTWHQTPQSRPHKTDAKPQAQPIRSTPRRLFPSHRESPVSRPKEEEKQRSISISPNPRRIHSSDKILTKSSQQHPMPECHGRTGHEKELPAAHRDVESRQSRKSAPAAQSKPEDKLSRLVRMVKTRKPQYTERDIRSHMDRLRQSEGGFSHKTFNAIVELVITHMESRETTDM